MAAGNKLTRALASILMSRTFLARLGGLMFGGARDLYKVFGWKTVLRYEDLLAKYLRQDVAGRIVDAPALALWADPPEISAPASGWDDKWAELVATTDLWKGIEKADKLAAIGRYSVLLLGFDDGADLSRPVRPSPNRKLLYVQAYSERGAELKELEDDPKSPDYMKPRKYMIWPFKDADVQQVQIPQSLKPLEVHASRVVHICENSLSDNLIGNPRLERCFNVLDDMLKTTGGTAETYWLTSNRGMQFNVDPQMELSPEDEADLSAEIDEYMHQQRRAIRTRGVEVNPLGSETPDPKNIFEVQMSLISGATGIPKRILIGSEAGQLASDQDRNNWADRIVERRASFGEPTVLKPLILRLQHAGVLPEQEVTKIETIWPDAFRLTPLEKAQTAAQRARSCANVAKALEAKVPFLAKGEGREFLELDYDPPPELEKEAKEREESLERDAERNARRMDPNQPNGRGGRNAGGKSSGTPKGKPLSDKDPNRKVEDGEELGHG